MTGAYFSLAVFREAYMLPEEEKRILESSSLLVAITLSTTSATNR